jgi:hypothetical protein
MKKIVIN